MVMDGIPEGTFHRCKRQYRHRYDFGVWWPMLGYTNV
jgi:hypothetical protein